MKFKKKILDWICIFVIVELLFYSQTDELTMLYFAIGLVVSSIITYKLMVKLFNIGKELIFKCKKK